jgi:hypothetical protein
MQEAKTVKLSDQIERHHNFKIGKDFLNKNLKALL